MEIPLLLYSCETLTLKGSPDKKEFSLEMGCELCTFSLKTKGGNHNNLGSTASIKHPEHYKTGWRVTFWK
jgi:hypothetical protein